MSFDFVDIVVITQNGASVIVTRRHYDTNQRIHDTKYNIKIKLMSTENMTQVRMIKYCMNRVMTEFSTLKIN